MNNQHSKIQIAINDLTKERNKLIKQEIAIDKSIETLVAELHTEQASAVDWENLPEGTKIQVTDRLSGQETKWRELTFYAYLANAKHPILCYHPDQALKYQSEVLLCYKFGRIPS